MSKTAAEILADEAFEYTEHVPAYDPDDRFENMIEALRERFDDIQADVIAACRVKAGLGKAREGVQ